MSHAKDLRALAHFIERYPEVEAYYLGDGPPMWFVDTADKLRALLYAAWSFRASVRRHERRAVVLIRWHEIDFRALIATDIESELDRWELPIATEATHVRANE